MYKGKDRYIAFLECIWYNVLQFLQMIGGIIIKKLHPKKKLWLDRHSKKILKEMSINSKLINDSNSGKRIKNRFIAAAPSKFSLINNTEETIEFFRLIVNDLGRKRFGRQYYFNLSMVEELSIDAVMYIIAILRNIKGNVLYKYRFSGNQPIKNNAKKLFQESGFFNYVHSYKKNIISNSRKIQIISGKIADPDVVKTICNFVNESCKTKKSFTNSLYEALIELMANTTQHAYKGEDILTENCWYVFVEDLDDRIKFVFLDTGTGIPNTIDKRFLEKLGEKFSLAVKDSILIHSALKGEFRSETKKANRGKGLKYVKRMATKGVFENFTVISGKGVCKIFKANAGGYELADLENSIFGTLFNWEISKNNERVERYKNE